MKEAASALNITNGKKERTAVENEQFKSTSFIYKTPNLIPSRDLIGPK